MPDTTSNSSPADVAPAVRRTPKSPATLTNPATCACSPFTTTDASPDFTLNGALTETPPTNTVTVRPSMSAPVLLYATPTDAAVALAKPSPRLNTADPVACIASFPSPRNTIATVALLTPARTTVPAVNDAEALPDTTSNSSPADVAPAVRRTPKSPATLTKPGTWACSPFTTTAESLFNVTNGAVTASPPTCTASSPQPPARKSVSCPRSL